MQKSKILIINIGNLAEEVAKNIVLANIKCLVICDNAKVTEEDTRRQFLLPEGTEGQSVRNHRLP
jgi:molybdopterin/thiamine biosynthesis adenylyltransferase